MEKIRIFLFLFVSLKYCNGNKNISLLKFKCIDDLIEVPVDFQMALNEFTVCGKFNLRFLKSAAMFQMEPDSRLWIGERFGFVVLDGVSDLVAYSNQTLLPNMWQHFCVISFKGRVKVKSS